MSSILPFIPFLAGVFQGNVPSDHQEELETTVNSKDKLLFLSEYEISLVGK